MMLKNLLTDEQLVLLKSLIDESENIIITCHMNADGDAIGASMGWAEYLKSVGKEPTIIVPDQYPDYLKWMPNTEKVMRYDKHKEKADLLFGVADLVFCLDYNVTSRVYDMEGALCATKGKRVLIDHHLGPEVDTVLTISHPEMSSTSEIVFRLVWQLGAFESLTKHFAAPIYCGMMTDTGAFTFNSKSPDIFFIISQLLTKGIDKDKIYRNVYNNYSTWAIRMRGYMMCQKLNVFEDVHASYFSISRKEMKEFHFMKGDAEGLVNEPLRIKGMRLSISLREDDRKDNLVWVSLRSVDSFPCNKMAEQFFNGGGHLNASGGKLYCSLPEAEQIVRQAILHFEDMLKC